MYSLDKPTARIMLAVTLVVIGLASGACSPGSDSDLVRSPRLEGSTADDATVPSRPTADSAERVVFMGTSLTAGLGLDDPSQRFTDRIQAKVDSVGLPFAVVNAGVSGDTSAGGLRRIGWLLGAPIRVLVLELGANDGLRGLPVEAMSDNLQAIIDSVQARQPDVRLVIAGMEAPPNLGVLYQTEFRDVFRDLAERNEAALIPFLLEGVAGVTELNQVDGIHPTAEGHARVSETVWAYLEPVLRAEALENRP